MMVKMMRCRSVDDSHQNVVKDEVDKSFRIKHEDISFFSRLLSRQETAKNNNTQHSFRVYYAEDVSVPFVWESQPGTPIHRFADAGGDAALRPPLTPPPSYFINGKNPPKKKKNLLRALLVKVSLKSTRSRAKPSPPAASSTPSLPSPSFSISPSFSSCSSSSHSSSSSSAFGTPLSRFYGGRRKRLASSGSSGYSFGKGIIEEVSGGEKSSASPACCGLTHRSRRTLSMH
ncbi:unnamed protein product [Cuscuta epithymum]|uniref:Uncharacterized protein n=1 Tax=Cuscuta epithymum TaxID=186058 RepID=A0AAV0DKI6_9ASTE|nr:unnamed protein product [Cuscuta epithymum]